METVRRPSEVPIANLEALYDAYHRQAIGLAYRLLGDLADAEEVAQEAFLWAWRNGASYDAAKGSARTWVLALVRHRSIDLLRARYRRPTHPLDVTLDWPHPGDVAVEAVARVDGQVAREALARLPPGQREVLELAFFAGLTHAEITARLGLPLGTVKGRIRLALNRLRLELGIHGAPALPGQPLAAPILVVDDDPAVRRLIGRALQDEGLSVVMAADGRQALDRAGRHPPALVVLDLLLPRLDGDGVAAALRSSRGEEIPILLISVDRALPQKAAQVGAYAYLEKPFDVGDLLSSVRRGLAGRSSGPGTAHPAPQA